MLVVYTTFRGLAPFDEVDARLAQVLRSDPSIYVEIYSEFVDTNQFEGPDYQNALASYLAAKYADVHFDLLIGINGPSIVFLASVRDRLFPGTPIVYGVVDERLFTRLPPLVNATGATTKVDVAGTIEVALELHPHTKRLAYILGWTNMEQNWRPAFRGELEKFADRVELIDLSDLPMDQLVERVAALPDDTVLLWAALYRDSAGHNYPLGQALARVRPVSKVPIYGILEHDLGHGILGGRITDLVKEADVTGHVALRVLRGEAADSIAPVGASESLPTFDWRELRAWNVDERRLPPGSVILFREPSAWDLYGWYILGAIAVILVQSLMIAGLVAQRRHRQRAQQALVERLRFEHLIADLSTRLGDVSPAGLDAELDRGLSNVLELFGVDRAHLVRFGDEKGSPQVEHSAAANGVEAGTSMVDEATYAEAVASLSGGRIIAASRLDELPTSLTSLRESFADAGLRSVLAVPLQADGDVLGALTLGTTQQPREWNTRLAPQFRLLADLFAGALVRQQTVEKLRRSEREAEDGRHQLAHLARVTTMGELSASFAHELNQPLTGIMMNAQTALRLLAVDPPNTDLLREILADIVDDDRRAGEVIRKLRMMLKDQAVIQGVVDLNACAAEVTTLVANDALFRGVEIDVDLDGEVPPVRGDRIQLSQVMLNLIVNAMDAMKETPASERRLTVRTRQVDDRTVGVEVQDRGTGIARDTMGKIFQPFFSTKKEGLGMGLAIARTIVEAQEGTLTAVNNADSGATFTVTLLIA